MLEITLVDFFSFFYRASLARFTNSLTVNGIQTGSLFSLYRSYGYILKNYRNVLFVLDGRLSTTLRKKSDSDYKKNRESIKRNYKRLGIYDFKDTFFKTVPFFYAINESYEADDVIASITKNLVQRNIKVKIMTVDTDLWQLTDFKLVKIVDMRHSYREVDEEYFEERFDDLKFPEFIPIYKALFGDPSDNISKSVKKRTRKKKFIEYLNFIGENFKGKISLEDVARKIYEEFSENFDVNLDEFLTKVEMVKLYDGCSYKVYYNKGSKEEYERVCKKYRFIRVPKFQDYETYLELGSSSLLNIFRDINNLDEYRLVDEIL
jgi:5'-3' exonuclease